MLFEDIEDDSVDPFSLAVEKVTRRIAKFFGFGDDGTTGGKFVYAENGFKQAGEPLLRVHEGGFPDAVERRVCIRFGGGGEANAIGHAWRAFRQAPERRASVRRVPRSPFPPGLRRESPCGASGR